MRDIALVSGYLVRCPLAGYAWQALHYLLGLRAAGLDPFFYEDTAYYADCFDPMTGTMGDAPASGIAFAGRFFSEQGFGDRWIFWDAQRNVYYGKSADEAEALCRAARVVVGLAAVNRLPRWVGGRRIFVDLDPGVTQVEAQARRAVRELLADYHVHFTIGANIGQAGCEIPRAGIAWRPTRPPVAIDHWDPAPHAADASFTTIGRWDERRRELSVGGQTYSWRKRQEWLHFVELPAMTGASFELAMDVDTFPGDRELLEAKGWKIADPLAVSRDPETYRQYIRASRGEFTVAKDLNVRLSSGWFSDRSACYLAAGRPVITQDTGFGRSFPTGKGLFAFRTAEEAAAAVRMVLCDFAAHATAARETAERFFAADRVILELLEGSA